MRVVDRKTFRDNAVSNREGRKMEKPTHIKLTPAELQSGTSRQQWAEGLIAQLPSDHDGRNSWLMTFGTGDEGEKLRDERDLWFDPEFQGVGPTHIHMAGTMVGKHIDECGKCGRDLRHPIHTRTPLVN